MPHYRERTPQDVISRRSTKGVEQSTRRGWHQLKRADYIDPFMKAIQWQRVSSRFAEAHRETPQHVAH